MTSSIVPPHPAQPIVDPNFEMKQVFRTWAQQVSRAYPIIGDGSPEGVIEAQQGQTYMDLLGTTGSVFYIKRDADIAGDRTLGWILV